MVIFGCLEKLKIFSLAARYIRDIYTQLFVILMLIMFDTGSAYIYFKDSI